MIILTKDKTLPWKLYSCWFEVALRNYFHTFLEQTEFIKFSVMWIAPFAHLDVSNHRALFSSLAEIRLLCPHSSGLSSE